MRYSIVLLAFSAMLGRAQSPPEIPYESVPNPLKLPADRYLGEAAGVAVNSKGHIFVYHRSARTQLLEFDGDGKFIREIGKDLYGFAFAHVVRIDKDDNIWCVDEGANMVIEFNPEGRVIMVLGRKPEAVETAARPEAPPARDNLFNRPTDVAWDAAGKNGNIQGVFGKAGKRPGQFGWVHEMACPSENVLYVGELLNWRVQKLLLHPSR